MNYIERRMVRDELLRAKAYVEGAVEMFDTAHWQEFRRHVNGAREILSKSLAAFTTAEDREQSS